MSQGESDRENWSAAKVWVLAEADARKNREEFFKPHIDKAFSTFLQSLEFESRMTTAAARAASLPKILDHPNRGELN